MSLAPDSTPGRLQRLFEKLLQPRREPFLVTGGLYLFTALYYTRQWPLQLASFLLMLAVALFWKLGLQGENGMRWSDFKLKTDRLWLTVLAALALAVFGWFYFKYYLYLTRGEPMRFEFGGSYPGILAILAVSTAEELFFRGYLQNRLRRSYGFWLRVLLPVVLLAAFKNVIHMWEGMALSAHLELLGLGVLHNILPSLWLEKTDNLTGPLLMHVFWDLLVYAPLGAIPYWVY